MRFLREGLLVFLLLAPLLFLNVKTSHDWGDDFAAYIHQTKNILAHKPQDKTGYIVNPVNLHDAPLAYQSGFPLMLAPIIAFFSEDISVLLFYVSFYYIGFGMGSFFFFRKHFSFVVSLVAVLILFYHPFFIGFKAQVMSDIPFGFLSMAAILIFLSAKKHWTKYLVLALITGFLMSVRSAGIVFVLALVAEHFSSAVWKNNFKKDTGRQQWFRLVLLLTIVFAEYFFLNKILFPVRTEGFIYYYQQFYSHQNVLDNLLVSLQYYYYVLKSFFNPNSGSKSVLVNITWFISVGFFLFGFLKKIISRIGFIEWLLLFYLLAVFLYADHHHEFRFLIPVFPFLIYYTMEGVKQVRFIRNKNPQWILLLVCAIVVLQYYNGIERIIKKQSAIVFGPEHRAGKEMLNYLKEHTPADAIISFGMPRTVCLYAERKCFRYAVERDAAFMEENFWQMKTDYVVQLIRNKGFYNRDIYLDTYISTYQNNLDSVWSNAYFTVYRFKE